MPFFAIILVALITLVNAEVTDRQFYKSLSPTYKGQALVVHGLNLKPEKMLDIISELNTRGYDAVLLKLHGHNNDIEEMRKVSCADWEEQVSNGFNEIKDLNKLKGGKILITGFSIGALLPLEQLMRRTDFKVDQAILFAPALSLKKTSYLVNFFKIFGDRFIVPSFSVEEYRAQSGTSMGAYRCLFGAVKGFEKGSLQKLNFPSLIFMSPKDGLVSYDGIKELSKKFVNSKIVELNNSKSKLKNPNHHLIIDKQSLGVEEWDEKVVKNLDTFLGR